MSKPRASQAEAAPSQVWTAPGWCCKFSILLRLRKLPGAGMCPSEAGPPGFGRNLWRWPEHPATGATTGIRAIGRTPAATEALAFQGRLKCPRSAGQYWLRSDSAAFNRPRNRGPVFIETQQNQGSVRFLRRAIFARTWPKAHVGLSHMYFIRAIHRASSGRCVVLVAIWEAGVGWI